MTLNKEKIHYFIFFWTISGITVLIELLYPKFLQFMQLFGFETTIIPISMLGFSAGALFVFYKYNEIGALFKLSLYFVLSIVAIPFLLFYFQSKFFTIILLGIPFFFSSAIITVGYTHFSPFFMYSSSATGYAAGVLLIVLFLERIGGENLLFISSLIIALSALFMLYINTRQRMAFALLSMILAGILFVNLWRDSFNFIKIMPPSGKRFVNYAGSDRLKERDVKLLASKWSLIARVDLIKENLSIYDSLFGKDIMKFANSGVRETFLDLKGKGDFYNLYYNNVVFTFIPYRDKITWKMPPYTLLENPSVLIIGLGGGVDIAIARYNNARRIVAVEINPAMVSLMRDSNIIPVNTYKLADVYLMDGRSFVESSKEQFNLIQLMFTELYVPFPNSLAFVENYLYTVEAFRAYLRRLNNNGIIFINKWLGNYETPTELLRITTTAYEALKKEGIEDPENNFIIVGYFISGWMTNGGYILIKKEPFSHDEIVKVKESLGEPMYLLYSPEDRDLNNPFSAFFRTSDITSFYEQAPLDISPTYDDRPYLNQFDKKLTEHKKLLSYLLVISFFLFFLILRGLKDNFLFSGKGISSLLSIIFIATGYMWVELILLQKFNILLGSPVLSMGVILVSFFFANGIGSYVVSILAGMVRKVLLAIIPLFLFILYFVVPEITVALLDEDFSYKLLSGILTASLTGFILGIPFPLLLNNIKEWTNNRRLPLLISFDGVFSVLAVGLIMLLSVLYGFNFLLLVSAFCYIPGVILIALQMRGYDGI